ncbi:MAG: hypothetical protein GC145_10375 [Caulobacter sp.]|nr:hypothetical protein [Caulobacter sp.]
MHYAFGLSPLGFSFFGGFTLGFGGVASMRRNTSSGLGVGSAMDITLEPLASAGFKLAWARRGIKQLKEALVRYDATLAKPLIFREDGFALDLSGGYPMEIPLILGDVIHGLRSSLDHLAVDLARANGRSGNAVYFPIADKADGLEKAIVSKNFGKAGEAACDLLRAIGPHREGNAWLRVLHDLDNMDKHKLIIPVRPITKLLDVKVSNAEGVKAEYRQIELGSLYVKIDGESGDTVTVGSITALTIFGDDIPPPFQAKPLIETLERAAKVVESVIEAFRVLTLGKVPDVPSFTPFAEEDKLKGPQPVLRGLVSSVWFGGEGLKFTE